MEWPDAEDLLAGPRGRRLCWALLNPGDCAEWDRVWRGAQGGDLTGLTRELAACVARTGPDSSVGAADELTLLSALVQPVDAAMYWQEPDDEDHALAAQEVRDALGPVARAVATAPGARWWPGPIVTGGQQYVQWHSGPGRPPAFTGAAAALDTWRAETLDDERSAGRRPKDPAAPWSGHWWSAPVPSGLVSTTRAIPGLGAIGLTLAEDGLGEKRARCWPVRPRPGARIFGISGPDRWIELVSRYPVDVSKSRRHDWWRATGRAGRWLIPDFAAVAADYDAVHLSVTGYLTTAGRALPVEDAHTVLAGWDPDQTFWLTDALTRSGPPTRWEQVDEGPLGWALTRECAEAE
jgi:hypothetical protein